MSNLSTWVKRDCGQHFGPPKADGNNRCRKCAYQSKLDLRYDLPAESMLRFAAAKGEKVKP